MVATAQGEFCRREQIRCVSPTSLWTVCEMDCPSFGVEYPSDGSGHLEHSGCETPTTQTHTNFPILTSGYRDNRWKTTPSPQLKTCVLEPGSGDTHL